MKLTVDCCLRSRGKESVCGPQVLPHTSRAEASSTSRRGGASPQSKSRLPAQTYALLRKTISLRRLTAAGILCAPTISLCPTFIRHNLSPEQMGLAIVKVAYRPTSGPNQGYVFEGTSAQQADASGGRYGGILYAYSDTHVRLWAPNYADLTTALASTRSVYATRVSAIASFACAHFDHNLVRGDGDDNLGIAAVQAVMHGNELSMSGRMRRCIIRQSRKSVKPSAWMVSVWTRSWRVLG